MAMDTVTSPGIADLSQGGPSLPRSTAASQSELIPTHPGRTLLPAPVASAVSFAARSSSLALRVGSFIGSYGFDAAKFTTLSSLELGRGMLEGILARACKDTIRRSQTEIGREDAESILEKSLENLHRTINSIVFWTTTGFHITGTTLSTVSDISQLLLTTLDQFFGSTDSSRAIASIITLIRREFQNPASGVQGERVTVVDLVLGLCGLAYLQGVCSRLIEEENRRLGIEEILWDVVVLRTGERVDIHGDSLYGVHSGAYETRAASSRTEDAHRGIVAKIERHGLQESEDDDELPEIRLKRQVMESLPQDAEVSITTSIVTTKTITVDISGTRALPLCPPEGVRLIEDTRDSTSPSVSLRADPRVSSPSYRVVYQASRNQELSTSIKREGSDVIYTPGFIVSDEGDSQDTSNVVEDSPPPVPPKPSVKERPPIPQRQLSSQVVTGSSSRGLKYTQAAREKQGAENSANQKRPRLPLSFPSALSTNNPISLTNVNRHEPPPPTNKATDKKGGFRSAFSKGPGPTLSSLLRRDDSGSEVSSGTRRGKSKIDQQGDRAPKSIKISQPRAAPPSRINVPRRNTSLVPKREAPHPPPNASRPNGPKGTEDPYPRSSSRASYISVHESRRDSIVSQTDTYSIHAADDYRPMTPTFVLSELRVPGSSLSKSRSERDVPTNSLESPQRNHRRAQSQVYTPSIYTLGTNDSYSSLIPFHYLKNSAFSDGEALNTLRRDGMVEGVFPRYHILRNVARYMRFASASYGSKFLRGMGMAKGGPIPRSDDTHHELQYFAHHTDSEVSSILLSSFVDHQGGSDGTGSTNSGIPLVHYISLDHESKAVVLSCRGTLGFEDVLADLTCDYDSLAWRGSFYKVHKGIHASARRLLYGGDGRVLFTLKQALDEFSDYGLVLTGHSLGAAVTALLGIMLSEPAASGTSFVTSAEPHIQHLGDGHKLGAPRGHICLPSDRPIHVFAYGPPATMSASLSRATRGLITSIINGNDLVPYLSLGVLHDFQAVALGFKSDNNAAKMEVKQRIWDAFQSGLADRWYNNPATCPSNVEDDAWAYAALKVLRANMTYQKLLPPGEVFVVESTRVLRRDAFLLEGEDHFGRPARRIVLRYVKDVERRFGEVRFGMSMLVDHSPGRYEEALSSLRDAILEDAR